MSPPRCWGAPGGRPPADGSAPPQDSNPFASLVFYWEPLNRQVRPGGGRRDEAASLVRCQPPGGGIRGSCIGVGALWMCPGPFCLAVRDGPRAVRWDGGVLGVGMWGATRGQAWGLPGPS